jgi:predicted RNA-binding protein with TRAM domain
MTARRGSPVQAHLSVIIISPSLLLRMTWNRLVLKRPRRHEKDEKKGSHFGGPKAPRSPVSVGEEYILTIEQMGKEGVGVAKHRGVSILINNTNPGDKVMVRITKVGRTYAVAEVFSRK